VTKDSKSGWSSALVRGLPEKDRKAGKPWPAAWPPGSWERVCQWLLADGSVMPVGQGWLVTVGKASEIEKDPEEMGCGGVARAQF
jgi:hypothetical protein